MRLEKVVDIDVKCLQWIYQYTQYKECRRIIWISRTGDGYLYLLIGLLLWGFEPEHGPIFFTTALLAYALEIPLYLMLKHAFKRDRPADLIQHFSAHITPADKFSLPSGHTAAAFLMAVILSLFYPAISPLAYIWASCIGISRVLLGVHYPSDVLLGALLGSSIGVFIIVIDLSQLGGL
ncbi:MAG: phosphatase PAP2 family protein [Glaciecola sp.]|jgi:undecaprenyl-diphosphatase|nr:phosphatase PAP2 family protein [Glaciecola sp.]MDG1816628.1 phosphatase PAP2 family protein [Glaciecola sp.]MDG2098408.1 phosphatase PAP2 family protein [Glaciecola sp.]